MRGFKCAGIKVLYVHRVNFDIERVVKMEYSSGPWFLRA